MKNWLAIENNFPAFDDGISELFRSELEETINEILEYELTVFLDYERYELGDNSDFRKDSYQQ